MSMPAGTGVVAESISNAAREAMQRIATERVARAQQETMNASTAGLPAAGDPGRLAAASGTVGELAPGSTGEHEGGLFGWLGDNNSGGQADTSTAQPQASEATISTLPNGRILLDTGDGDDRVEVTQDQSTGELTVDVNGEQFTFTREEGNILVIATGDGDDFVKTHDDVTANLSYDLGDGDDFLVGGAGHERIEAGAGDDTIFGGAGRDYIHGASGDDRIFAEEGNDIVYGGDGDDVIFGRGGDDYIDGGTGNDRIYGGEGDDILSGGLGDDFIEGGSGGNGGTDSGDDVIYAGRGTDTVVGGTGDVAYVEAGDTVERGHREDGDLDRQDVVIDPNLGSSIIVDPNLSPDEQARIEADIETLRSSPVGREMLAAIDQNTRDTGHTVTITTYSEDNGTAAPDSMQDAMLDPVTGQPGPGSNVTVRINPQLNSMNFPLDANGDRVNTPLDDSSDFRDTPPIVVLYHELAHAYDEQLGRLDPGVYRGTVDADGYDDTGMRNWERIAVGLEIDHDGDPRTPQQVDPTHPEALTENALRDEFGLEPRTSYDIIKQGE